LRLQLSPYESDNERVCPAYGGQGDKHIPRDPDGITLSPWEKYDKTCNDSKSNNQGSGKTNEYNQEADDDDGDYDGDVKETVRVMLTMMTANTVTKEGLYSVNKLFATTRSVLSKESVTMMAK
jgi:hypothetical protein